MDGHTSNGGYGGQSSNGGYGGQSIRINLGRYTIDTRIIADTRLESHELYKSLDIL